MTTPEDLQEQQTCVISFSIHKLFHSSQLSFQNSKHAKEGTKSLSFCCRPLAIPELKTATKRIL
jgi:hypothetical protein